MSSGGFELLTLNLTLMSKEKKKLEETTTPPLLIADVSGAKRKVCDQHQFEYYGFPIASKRCKVCGYEKM